MSIGALDRLAKSELGIPLIELPVLLQTRDSHMLGHSLSDRERAFGHAYTTKFNVIKRKLFPEQGACFRIQNASR